MKPAAVERSAYERIQRVNWSTIKALLKSPAHYQHALVEKGGKDTPARKRGRAVHVAVFEPLRFAAAYTVWRGGKRAGKKWKAFAEEFGHLEILTEKEHVEAIELADAVRSNPIAARYLADGEPEVTMLWAHSEPGGGAVPGFQVDCKGRADFRSTYNGGALIDLKVTRDASPDGFAAESWRYRYHTQAAFYSDGDAAERLAQLTAAGALGLDLVPDALRLPFLFLAVEAERPRVVQVYRVPADVLSLGRDEYRTLLQRREFCRTEKLWPGYFDGEGELSLPRWAVPFSRDQDLHDLDLVVGEAPSI